ncbi:MAG TPA: HEAT repeat domain-containing protein, partial [Planctomycetota bacterium]|nr:HEAT repeat domain-containing protein [Planctomycetota bacterium]
THWLVDRLAKDSTSIEVRHGLTRALGLVGDKPALDSLLALARDDKAMALPRAFAVVALGMIGDQDDLPWNASLASGVHYRASVGTLTGEVGVLDIL